MRDLGRAALAGLLSLLIGCGGDDAAHSVHDHEDEDEQGHHDHHHGPVVPITRWSETLELFAEHPAAVRGEPVPFLAHLTVLEGFRPLTDARVRLVLTGPARLVVEADMLRPGIYELTPTFAVAGTYQGRVEIVQGGEGAVGGFEIVVAAEAPPEGEDEEDAAGITFLKEQQWRVPFDTAPATAGSVAPTVEVPGELEAPPSGMAHVHAPVAGRIMAGGRDPFPIPGQAVEAGERLATLAPTPSSPEDASQADSEVVEAEARLENARATLARAERLLADQAIPERQLQEAQRDVRTAASALAAARRARSLYASASGGRGGGSWDVVSPIAGVVDEVAVSPGEAVEANELLVRVIDPSVRWLAASIPEAWAATARPSGAVRYQLAGEERWREMNGQLVNVSSAVDERSRTVRAIWSLESPSPELRVGAAARVSIPVGEPVAGVVVPRSALIDVEGREVVYVQVEGERFVERPVRTGASDGARTVVLEGLSVGERLVTQGGYLVRLASTAGQAGAHAHGHPH